MGISIILQDNLLQRQAFDFQFEAKTLLGNHQKLNFHILSENFNRTLWGSNLIAVMPFHHLCYKVYLFTVFQVFPLDISFGRKSIGSNVEAQSFFFITLILCGVM